ncbi:MAG: N-acetyl-gamma-glutamyl-phosphate reductase [Desulfomonile sp.]|jgi:N-acetyl-gamma-glutamyl-phosphate reductase|nr:N-acetyl-gamma-glutamyl-phosphate reductase [Deltaproteobacteria bacterium]
MIRALILGATGYTGIELVRILSSHPEVKVVGGSSRTWAGKKAGDVFPFIWEKNDFHLSLLPDLVEKPEADIAFLALPHGEAAGAIRPFLDAGLKVVDLSADTRLHDPEIYRQWYGLHSDPELLDKAVYGLPEIHRALIRNADLVANPGCYPTTVILGVAPLLNFEAVDTDCPIVDSKSGVSGAGRGAKIATSFCEVGEGFKPYGVIRHRHIPEMEQELSGLAGRPIRVRFTPHLIPVSRGMVSTIYVPMKEEVTWNALHDIYTEYYRSEPFVRILSSGAFPDTSKVRGSNQCHISVEVDERTGWIVVMVAIDNLVKGASGSAVQNMNIMIDADETTGLTGLPVFP